MLADSKSLMPSRRAVFKAAARGTLAGLAFAIAAYGVGVVAAAAHLAGLFFAFRAIGGVIGEVEQAALAELADFFVGGSDDKSGGA